MATFVIAQWLETVLWLSPLLYALGYFAVENKVAYGLSGLTASGWMIWMGYQVLEIDVFLVMGLHLLSWVTIGTIFALMGQFRGMAAHDRESTPVGSPHPTTAAEREATARESENPDTRRAGGAALEHMCIIHGRVLDARNERPIPDAKVIVLGSMTMQATTTSDGHFQFEIPDTSWGIVRKMTDMIPFNKTAFAHLPNIPFIRKSVYIEASKDGYKKQTTGYYDIVSGLYPSTNIKLQRILSTDQARTSVSITFTDAKGLTARPDSVRRGEWYGALIKALGDARFPKTSFYRTPQEKFELVNQDTNDVIMTIGPGRSASDWSIEYRNPQELLLKYKVPSRYNNNRGAPLPKDRDVHVKIIADINVE